jgi:hypothetical protein
VAQIQILYYDDDPSEASSVARTLEGAAGDFAISVYPPPHHLRDVGDRSIQADLVMVDLDLTRPLASGPSVGYQGTTLVSHLRTLADDRPLVVITKENILNNLSAERLRQLHRSLTCDDLIVKQNVLNSPQTEVARLRSLSDGYKVLRETSPKGWSELLALLNAQPGTLEAERVRQAAPPLKPSEQVTSAVATWIRKMIMGYPGILYDDLHAATNLGLSVGSFRSIEIQELLRYAAYDGLFAMDNCCRYWWKDRLRAAAISTLMESDQRADIIPGFYDILRSGRGLDITPSRCIWDGTAGADHVCYLTSQPVKLENSLAYYADNRPVAMDEPRVSFRAIRESPDFQPELLDPIGRDLLTAIMNLADPS